MSLGSYNEFKNIRDIKKYQSWSLLRRVYYFKEVTDDNKIRSLNLLGQWNQGGYKAVRLYFNNSKYLRDGKKLDHAQLPRSTSSGKKIREEWYSIFFDTK